MQLNPRHAVPAAVLAAALAAGAAACGSSGDPLAGLGSGTIISKAVANTEAASSTKLNLAISDSGQTVTIDFTLIPGKGCEGTMSSGSQGTAKIVYDGKTGWLNADTAFWKSNGGDDPAVLSTLANKWMKTSDKSFIDNFTAFCDLKQLLSGFSGGNDDGMPEVHTTMDGQPALELKDTGDSAVIYVSDVAKPVVLKVSDPGTDGGTFSFSSYGATAKLTIPPASQVIDGSHYGM